ncbi:fumarylacetoacetate hydrolase family protein [Paracoccus sp. (in: a-proteobacteria)]|uniref:fumarylacetoacetate hydrolase family protein n=1 Tax=Paracoccus sp. TaxID=267 RepID=UPI0026E10175|nr:fumarylacetoacetate hydrolase family protein [Paracoccus sp. (in: a-proteobacteria)]MDO5646626.1 fumarylacetoacetate hydrolase family protein [Paracoccus sp. (in: a-proteobacteria)]
MTDFVIPAPRVVAIPVHGGGQFPVRRIFCVGQNYAEHAREMGGDPDRAPPFFFTKPADAVVTDGVMPYPPGTDNLHFEGELVVAIGQGGRDIPAAQAQGHIWGYAVGLDMTRRDMQAQAKAAGRPWDMAKGFDASAPIGLLHRADRPLDRAALRLTVDGDTRQQGDLSDMIWPVADVIAHLSGLVTLAPGDLIFTGTPAGVGAVTQGQVIRVTIDGLTPLEIRIT